MHGAQSRQGPDFSRGLDLQSWAVIIGVDVLFFRDQFWERLIVNIGIVMVFAAFYLRFLKNTP